MNFTDVNGWRWPADDRACREAVFREVANLERVYPHVRTWDACVQAGGNCGVYARALATRFAAVYTAEPDPDNFACLAANCPEPGIVKLQACFGEGLEPPVDLKRIEHNCGAHQVHGTGSIPVLAIDALRLPSCGLIHLDIEGYEARALHGAAATIDRCRPVIVIENKGHSTEYGTTPVGLHELIVQGFDYRRVDKYGNDSVYVPC